MKPFEDRVEAVKAAVYMGIGLCIGTVLGEVIIGISKVLIASITTGSE